MKFAHYLLALCAAVAFSGNAAAATYTGVTGANAEHVEDFNSGSLVAFNLDMFGRTPVTLSYKVEASDLLSPYLSFNAFITNLTGTNFDGFRITLGNVLFANVGSVTGFGPASFVGGNANAGWAGFSASNGTDIRFGNVFPEDGDGSVDWLLNLSGLQAGDTFTITAAVPEPETYAMLLAGLGLMGFAARRRKQKQA